MPVAPSFLPTISSPRRIPCHLRSIFWPNQSARRDSYSFLMLPTYRTQSQIVISSSIHTSPMYHSIIRECCFTHLSSFLPGTCSILFVLAVIYSLMMRASDISPRCLQSGETLMMWQTSFHLVSQICSNQKRVAKYLSTMTALSFLPSGAPPDGDWEPLPAAP